MYNYFDSKQELIMAVILREMDATTPLMAELEAAATPAERLRIMLELSLRMMTERLPHSKLLLKLSMQLEDIPELKPVVRGKYTSFMPYLAQVFRELDYAEPEMEAAALAALLDGLLLQYVTVGDLLDFEGLKQWILKRYVPDH
jgi:AcrR family transcriptional regulator